jgi:hypothetical protein
VVVLVGELSKDSNVSASENVTSRCIIMHWMQGIKNVQSFFLALAFFGRAAAKAVKYNICR